MYCYYYYMQLYSDSTFTIVLEKHWKCLYVLTRENAEIVRMNIFFGYSYPLCACEITNYICNFVYRPNKIIESNNLKSLSPKKIKFLS